MYHNILKNIASDLEKEEINKIERALYSEEVKESRRIARNVNLNIIKGLRAQAKRIKQSKKALKNIIKAIEEEEKQMNKQIRQIQRELDKNTPQS